MMLFELYYGIARSDGPEEEQEKVKDVLSSKSFHPADATVTQKAGRRPGQLANEGNAVADGDVIIGATAELVDEPVLTRTIDDFDRLDVDVETY